MYTHTKSHSQITPLSDHPAPPGGRSCRPPKFNNGEEMDVWWMEWALGLPNENAGDGPIWPGAPDPIMRGKRRGSVAARERIGCLCIT